MNQQAEGDQEIKSLSFQVRSTIPTSGRPSMDPTIKDFEAAIAELENDRQEARGGRPAARNVARALRARRPAVALLPRAPRAAERRIELLNERGELTAAPRRAWPARRGSGDGRAATLADLPRPTLRAATIDAALHRASPLPPACRPRRRGHALHAFWPAASGCARCLALAAAEPWQHAARTARFRGRRARRSPARRLRRSR